MTKKNVTSFSFFPDKVYIYQNLKSNKALSAPYHVMAIIEYPIAFLFIMLAATASAFIFGLVALISPRSAAKLDNAQLKTNDDRKNTPEFLNDRETYYSQTKTRLQYGLTALFSFVVVPLLMIKNMADFYRALVVTNYNAFEYITSRSRSKAPEVKPITPLMPKHNNILEQLREEHKQSHGINLGPAPKDMKEEKPFPIQKEPDLKNENESKLSSIEEEIEPKESAFGGPSLPPKKSEEDSAYNIIILDESKLTEKDKMIIERRVTFQLMKLFPTESEKKNNNRMCSDPANYVRNSF